MDDAFRQHVLAAAARPEVRDAVGRVYADLQREIDARRPACAVSGRCCRFEEYGHRLYVTTMELAAFVHGLSSTGVPEAERLPAQYDKKRDGSPFPLPWDGTGCPFQVGKLCGVHAIRPFGCRMFFCDATATEWQNEQYERFHAELKRLHDELGVPYRYVEWRAALAGLGLTNTAAR